MKISAPTIHTMYTLDLPTCEGLERLERRVFDNPILAPEWERDFRDRSGLLLCVATLDDEWIGYKIGYKYSARVFFSVSGGVAPGYRRQGIASRLMTEQHSWARKLGYKYVRTHTKNKYREMLLLNISAGFDVTGVDVRKDEVHHTIILQYQLDAPEAKQT